MPDWSRGVLRSPDEHFPARSCQLATKRAPRNSGPRYGRATAADNALRGPSPCCGQLTIVTVIRIRPSVVSACCSRGNHHPVSPRCLIDCAP